MAYDETVAERGRRVLAEIDAPVEEKKMFGGLCWMVSGHMAGGIVGERLCIRVGPERYAEYVAERHAEPMTFTGMALKGMVYVNPPGFAKPEDLAKWLGRGVAFARSLPKKTAKKKAPAKKAKKKGAKR